MSQRKKSKKPKKQQGKAKFKQTKPNKSKQGAEKLKQKKKSQEIILAKKEETAIEKQETLKLSIEKMESAPTSPEPQKKATPKPKKEVIKLKGEVMIPPKDRPAGALRIMVESEMRPWYDLPVDSTLKNGDIIEFTAGPERVVENITFVKHIQTKAEIEEKSKLERSKSPLVDTIKGGITITEYDIQNGVWKLITGGSKIRTQPDWELETIINGITISFHVHPPSFAKGTPLPGEIMKNGYMTDTQTSSKTIKAILKFHPRPKSWDETREGPWLKKSK